MTRDLKLSLFAAVACHAILLYGFQVALVKPAKLMRDTAVEVSLVAAPAAPAPPAPEPPPPAPTPPTPPPEPQPEVKPPVPLPVQPEPVLKQPEPAPTPTPSTTVTTPAPAPTIGDNSAPAPGADQTTTQSQPGEPAHTKYRHNPKPAYPPMAKRRGQEGLVLLSVRVTADGHATDVSLRQSSGYPLLDDSALAAVKRWEFEPARVGAIAIESEIEVPVRFQLRDAE